MTDLTHGSLFTGYGGIDLAAEALGAHTAWVSDIDPGACKVLAHRFPQTPNLGDLTRIDWADVEPVDLLSGGTPCQDLSHAGKRAGMTEGTRSNLWVTMREAIAQLRPTTVIWENVRGAYSAAADSEVEPCPGCVGDRPDVHLRALGRVLGDLAELGYDARWHGLRAADVGAPHIRFRVFVVAHARGQAVGLGTGLRASQPRGIRRGRPDHLHPPDDLLPTPRATDGTKGGPNQRGSSGDLMLPSAVQHLLPTPAVRDYKGRNQRNDDRCLPGALLPTPAVNDMGDGKTLEWWDEWAPRQKASDGTPAPHGRSLAIEAQRLLPTPTSADHKASGSAGYGGNDFCTLTDATVRLPDRWGKYAEAIAAWEQVTRPAPPPTEPGRNGNPRLSPRFTEWLMGAPDGWITDVPGITRNEALRLCGNGVVPQQCIAAVNYLMGELAA